MATKKKTVKKKTTKTKRKAAPSKKKAAKKKRKARTPRIASHGKTAAQRKKYIEYLGAKKKLIKDFFG